MRKIKESSTLDRVRDLTEAEKEWEKGCGYYGDGPVDYLSMSEYRQRVRLAEWYMRRAGMSPVEPGMATPVSGDLRTGRVFLVAIGLVVVTAAVLSVIARLVAQ
jgi:hypothetical protein